MGNIEFSTIYMLIAFDKLFIFNFGTFMFIMSSHEMWRHTLVILSNVECARIGWSDVQTPTPTTTPKLQLDFFDLKSSWSLGVVVVGVWCQTPPPHHHS